MNQNCLNMSTTFLHSGYPKDCVAPLILSTPVNLDCPAMSGTGFFARRGRQIYFVTARHCFGMSANNSNEDWEAIIAAISLPFKQNIQTNNEKDYVQFSQVISICANDSDIPGKYLDVVFLEINSNMAAESQLKELLRRAIKLPPTGEWLESFVDRLLEPKKNIVPAVGGGQSFTAMGFPYAGTASKIEYLDQDSSNLTNLIHMQPANINGSVEKGDSADRLKFKCYNWSHDMGGFSGSPVIVGFKNENGPQYALAGMLVSGGSAGVAQFLKISFMVKAFFQSQQEIGS